MFETLAYLENLSSGIHDPGGFLEIVEIGRSTMMGISGQYAGIELDSLVVARVSLDPTAPEPVRPAILLTCGIHPNEWIASEVCLGFVDWLVKGANANPVVQDAEDLLERVEIWAVIQGNPGGRLWDDGGWAGEVGWYDELDPCPFGLHNCGRFGEIQCRNLASDVSNCGICNGKCGSGATCVQGVCTLPAEESAVVDD